VIYYTPPSVNDKDIFFIAFCVYFLAQYNKCRNSNTMINASDKKQMTYHSQDKS